MPIQEKDPRRNTFVAIGEFKPETLNAMPRNLTTPTKRRLKVEFEPQQVRDAKPRATYQGWTYRIVKVPEIGGVRQI